jgi:uncharacterized membrane protein YgcG
MYSRWLESVLACGAAIGLAGCIVSPGPYDYEQPYYAAPSPYYAPAPYYAPHYVAPSISLGFGFWGGGGRGGGFRGGGGGHGRR